ncbi:hypothetical protein BDR22DRAFT_890947 [Usnea florida]
MNSANSAQIIEVLEKSGHEVNVLADHAGCCIHAHVDTLVKAKVRVEMESMYFGLMCLIRGILPHMRRRCIMNTNEVTAVVLGKNPMPGDYSRCVTEHTMRSLSSGKHSPNGDKDNAIRRSTKSCSARVAEPDEKSSDFFPSAPIWRQE